MTESKTLKARRKREPKKTEPTPCSTGNCPVPVIAPKIEPPADPFKPLGESTVDGVTTLSFAAEMGNVVYWKNVTIREGLQSESIVPVQGAKIIPASTPGYYKISVKY